MWNLHVLRVLGQKCGGFLDFVSCMKELSFLPYAIAQLRGNKDGFIQEYLEIDCWGKRIQLKFTPLNGRTPWFHDIGNFPGQGPRGEEGDVEGRVGKKSTAGLLYADQNLSKSDRVGGKKRDGVTDESLHLSLKGGSSHG